MARDIDVGGLWILGRASVCDTRLLSCALVQDQLEIVAMLTAPRGGEPGRAATAARTAHHTDAAAAAAARGAHLGPSRYGVLAMNVVIDEHRDLAFVNFGPILESHAQARPPARRGEAS